MWQDSIKELRKKVVSTETFIEEAIILHGNKYDYTNVCFQNLSSTVKVSCPIQGIKDKLIIDIENKYNSGSSKIFNVQFTTEKDFLAWVNSRIMRFPDEATIQLLKNL